MPDHLSLQPWNHEDCVASNPTSPYQRSVLFEDHNKAIWEMLQQHETIGEAQLEDLTRTCQETGTSLADAVIRASLIERGQLLEMIADCLQYPYLPTPPQQIDTEVIRAIEPAVAQRYGVVPIRIGAHFIEILAKDPFNNHIVDDLACSLAKEVHLIVTDPDELDRLLRTYYGGSEEPSLEDYLGATDSGEPIAEGLGACRT